MDAVLRVLKSQGLTNHASYFERAVTNAGLIRTLKQQAGAFEFLGQDTPCAIIPELTFELGARKLNSQLFVSLVDLPASQHLTTVLSRKLGYELTPKSTGVAWIFERTLDYHMSKRLAKPTWRLEDFLWVVRCDERRLISQHLVSRSAIRSIVLPRVNDEQIKSAIERFKAATPHASAMVRGSDDSVIAWDGKSWGRAEAVIEGNVVLGGHTFATGEVRNFRAADLSHELRNGMGGRHAEFQDDASGLMLPGHSPQPGRPGTRDWLMTAGDLVHQVGSDPGTPSGGGGGGGGSSADLTWIFTGTGTCARQFTSRDSCYSCCDSLGSSMLTVSLTAATALTATAGAILIPGSAAGGPAVIGGIIATAVIGIVLVTTAAVTSLSTAEACKDACDTPSGGGQSTVSSGLTEDGEWIT